MWLKNKTTNHQLILDYRLHAVPEFHMSLQQIFSAEHFFPSSTEPTQGRKEVHEFPCLESLE